MSEVTVPIIEAQKSQRNNVGYFMMISGLLFAAVWELVGFQSGDPNILFGGFITVPLGMLVSLIGLILCATSLTKLPPTLNGLELADLPEPSILLRRNLAILYGVLAAISLIWMIIASVWSVDWLPEVLVALVVSASWAYWVWKSISGTNFLKFHLVGRFVIAVVILLVSSQNLLDYLFSGLNVEAGLATSSSSPVVIFAPIVTPSILILASFVAPIARLVYVRGLRKGAK